MNHLITDAMLDDAAVALTQHRLRRGKCSCGAAMPIERHLAEVVADTVAPTLVAEMMDLLGVVKEQAVRELRKDDV